MHQDNTIGSRIFDYANYLFLFLVSLAAILPFMYVVISSFSTEAALIPTQFTTAAYNYIFTTSTFVRSLGVSVYITLFGTMINLVFTSLMAYSLAHKHLAGRRVILLMVVFTMLFNGGMIPTYFIVKATGLMNTMWALMIPNAISAFYLIILKNFFQSIPDELKESARMDGAHELGILLRIVIPLSLPAMAAFGLFYAVGLWNQYFSAVLYINSPEKWPVQVLLRQVVILSQGSIGDSGEIASDTVLYGEGIKMAVIVISTVPILLVYPFLQKHFAKGVLLGSVKG
ncbi:carbohydrate ABC transporter permease [Paenibacillus abyssi]|uniref:Protein LplC n=1 Tax=Paenibacillus abyssi TaxID=1340531 RepID=A0A917LDK1_9BACL|nr:carbohydrate ABC transporter permease [Paenibacillus abyssi]GGG14811.1 protein LplC [Paenibacillus abyssi]